MNDFPRPVSLTLLRSAESCANGKTCPAVRQAPDRTLLITGKLVGAGPGRTTVSLPAGLLPELPAELDGTVLVTGALVTDPAVTAQMAIGPGEAGIEVAAARMPEVARCA